jgi:hypothetical protein
MKMKKASYINRESLGVINGRHRILETKCSSFFDEKGNFKLTRCVGRIYSIAANSDSLPIDIECKQAA